MQTGPFSMIGHDMRELQSQIRGRAGIEEFAALRSKVERMEEILRDLGRAFDSTRHRVASLEAGRIDLR